MKKRYNTTPEELIEAINWFEKQLADNKHHGHKGDWFREMKLNGINIARTRFDVIWSDRASPEMKKAGQKPTYNK